MNHKEAALWRMFSKFIRLRDSDWRGYCKCISCSTIKQWKEMDCGHYIPKGSDSALKYNEINNNGQCTSCNVYKSGNLIEYRRGLIEKYGEAMVNKLEQSHYFKTTKKKLNQLEINALYNLYKEKIKMLESNRNLLKPYKVKQYGRR